MTPSGPVRLFLLLVLGIATGVAARGEGADYPWDSGPELAALERRFKAAVSPDRLRAHLEVLTREPHPPGSSGDRAVEEYIYAQLRSFGLDPEWDERHVPISVHVSSHLEITFPQTEVLNLYEDVVPGDPFSARTAEFPAWHAFSPSGEAEGEVVYANFGTAEDFARLKELGIDLTGTIVLARHYQNGRGEKIRLAEAAGAAGVLLFSDPLDDGYFWGDVYPDGPWRPPSGIQRGSVGEGLGIPSLPISAREARKLLERMRGPAVPWRWNGAMGFTYRIGPGPVRVRMRTENRTEVKPIRSILTFIQGREAPDQWVLTGNHHDAHLFGAGDPNSGTAVQLEIARILGGWLRDGWRPRRSILIANWCDEEYGLTGSTRWVEEHAEAVRDKVVVNFNSDSAVFNVDTPLFVGASPTLAPLIRHVAARITDPRSGRPFADVWLEHQREYSNWFSSMGDSWQILPGERRTRPKVSPLAGIDDNTAFYYHLVVPGTDMFFGTDYGMYHSLYENFHWMSTVGDPTFRYHGLMAQLLGLLVLRVAEDEYIPFDYAEYAGEVLAALDALVRRVPHGWQGELAALRTLALDWQAAAEGVQRELASAPPLDRPARLDLNARWYRLERAFYHPEGLPERPWFRNLFAGPVAGVPAEGDRLPGLQYAVGLGDSDVWLRQSALYRERLQRLAGETRAILAELARTR